VGISFNRSKRWFWFIENSGGIIFSVVLKLNEKTGMSEKVWFAIVLILIAIILSTDPKTSIGGAQKNQLNMLFSSASDSQNFLRTFTWIVIATFYITTLLLCYYG